MPAYADLKVAPVIHAVLGDAARRQYGTDYGALSRAANEAAVAWLVLRADDDVVDDALAAHGFDSVQDLVDQLTTDAAGADGRYATDPLFDPLAAVRTPRDLSDGDADDHDPDPDGDDVVTVVVETDDHDRDTETETETDNA